MRFGADQKIKLLQSVPLFSGLSKTELGRIARIADELDVREGKELIREGERGRQFFVLTSGGADVRRRGRKIATMKKGDFFGEIALVSDRQTTAAVTASKPSTVLVVTDTAFKGLLRDFPNVQLKVLQALAERVPAD